MLSEQARSSNVGGAQQELQRRWQYLAEALGLSHSGIFAWRVGSNTLEWSDETYRILGFARETHPTLDLVFDRVHPGDRERFLELRDRAARDGMDLDFEHRLLLPNGDIRHLHVVAHAGSHISGNREYIGIVTDITERKRADQERQALSRDLEESKARLEEAQRVAQMGHFQWDLMANRMIFSNELHRIFESHLPEGSIDIELIREKIHPEDRERTFQVTEEAIRGGVHVDVEYRIVRSNGEVRTLHSLGTVKRDTLGLAYEYLGTIQDITERKHGEQALQQCQFYLREGERLAQMGTWASSDLGIRWSDDLGVYWSDELYKLYGLDPKSGPPNLEQYLALMHPHDRALMVETLKGMHEQRCGCDITKRIIRPDGEVRHVRCVGVPDIEGEVFKGFHGTEMDVTQHELLTQELRREQAYLAEAQRLTHTGSWASNLVTRQVFHSSDENNRLYGFDVSQHSNPFDLHYSSILVEDELALRPKLENAIRTGADFDVEYRIRRADGAIRFLRGIGHHDPTHELGEYFGITMDITDRKRVEEEREALSNALQQSNARLEEAQRVALIGHYEFNPIENQVTWSAELCRIWGLSPVNRPIDLGVVFEMVHPEDRELAARAVEEIIRSGSHLKYEHRIVRPDGEVRFLQVLGTVKRDASGRAYELFGTCQDITDRKLAEQALRRSEVYLSEGQRLAHMGSWAFNTMGFDYWSPELFEVHGLDPHGKPPTVQEYLDLVHPEDRDFVERVIQALLVDRSGFDFTKRIVRPDGKVRYVRCVGVPVTSGEVFEGFVGTGIDVTEQELLTQELRREQAYLTDAQSMAHIGSWVFNLVTHKLLHSSNENARLYGFDPGQGPISAERFFDTQHVEDAPHVNAALERAVREGTDFYLDEYRIHHTDGSIRFLRAIGHRNPSGEPGEYVGVTMDITERKRAEQQRERLHQLEAELAHINRVNMMGELAAALAHEIKQPIAASITSANALLRWLAHDPPDLERARAAATRIERDGNRAADVINSLQSFFRRGTPAKSQSVDLREIIGEMTDLLRAEADRHSITIDSGLDAELPKTLANRVQLQQVLLNLMLNAIEAMKDTGGELKIRSRADKDGRLLVSVSDTGIGLHPESIERIFDPFHTTKPQGTGMGLTITRSIVESYGGRVWASANHEAGTTFSFTLPSETEARV
jgi:PAS domain S-box-containing protein